MEEREGWAGKGERGFLMEERKGGEGKGGGGKGGGGKGWGRGRVGMKE